jgi:hypothetical protein
MALGKEIHHIKDWLFLDPTATMISVDALVADVVRQPAR